MGKLPLAGWSFQMNQSPEQIYIARRHRESVQRAEAATDPAIGRIHREFAARYAARLEDGPTLNPVGIDAGADARA
jgi:hypothetical protein